MYIYKLATRLRNILTSKEATHKFCGYIELMGVAVALTFFKFSKLIIID